MSAPLTHYSVEFRSRTAPPLMAAADLTGGTPCAGETLDGAATEPGGAVLSPVAFYNEIDPFAAQWLRELIKAGHIAPGIVDERDIRDIRPDELAGYTQCHFFAGIGVWSYALRRAGWPDDKPVWTASCPCQPFSVAGKGKGVEDERHLWPAFEELRRAVRPVVSIGEQVASKDGLAWLDIVQADVEAAGDAFGAVDICAAGVGAPHIRQRLYWLAYADGGNAGAEWQQCGGEQRQFAHDGGPVWLGVTPGAGHEGFAHRGCDVFGSRGTPSERAGCELAGPVASCGPELTSPTNGLWRDADWLFCRDGKWRPVEPGTFPLAHGAPARVGRLRGYGNAINAEVATAFIEAVIQTLPQPRNHPTRDLAESNGAAEAGCVGNFHESEVREQ